MNHRSQIECRVPTIHSAIFVMTKTKEEHELDRLFTKFGDFIIRRSKFTIIVFTILTVFFASGLPKLEMQMGNNVFVNEASDVFKRTSTYQEQFGGECLL